MKTTLGSAGEGSNIKLDVVSGHRKRDEGGGNLGCLILGRYGRGLKEVDAGVKNARSVDVRPRVDDRSTTGASEDDSIDCRGRDMVHGQDQLT
jgi:hypothetical protein